MQLDPQHLNVNLLMYPAVRIEDKHTGILHEIIFTENQEVVRR